jgi:hypothetical protein
MAPSRPQSFRQLGLRGSPLVFRLLPFVERLTSPEIETIATGCIMIEAMFWELFRVGRAHPGPQALLPPWWPKPRRATRPQEFFATAQRSSAERDKVFSANEVNRYR